MKAASARQSTEEDRAKKMWHELLADAPDEQRRRTADLSHRTTEALLCMYVYIQYVSLSLYIYIYISLSLYIYIYMYT